MSRRHSAKYKIDRRVGENIWGRPKSPVNKRPNKPGQHGPNRRGRVSDFGMQLMAKQKLKFHYGDITEKQFKATFVEAARRKGNTAENLIGLLESRLDDRAVQETGRVRRYFKLTPKAMQRLKETRRSLERLWEGLDALVEEKA